MYQCPHWRANAHPRLPLFPCSSNTLSSHRSSRSPYNHSSHVALSPSLTDLTSPLTPASLLKLGAPVITTLSFTDPLNTPHSHSAFLIPLSSCPRFSSQSSTSSMNIAEVLWCWSAFWFYPIATCDWRRGRVNGTQCMLWLMKIWGWCQVNRWLQKRDTLPSLRVICSWWSLI